MNPDAPLSLEALRPLHLPTGGGAVSGAVVAAIATGFAAALLVGLVRWLRARRHASVRRAALDALALTTALEPEARRVAQARLLRRLVRTLDGEAAAAERGEAWGRTLDRVFATGFFGAGAGRVLVDGLYRRPEPGDAAVLDAELARLFSTIRA